MSISQKSQTEHTSVKTPLDRMLEACPQASGPNSAGWYNNPDNPRFDFRPREDGSIALHPWTNHTVDDVLAQIGLTHSDLHRDKRPPSFTHPTLDVVSLAQARRIHWKFLYELGLSDEYHYRGRRYVKVPYHNLDGAEHTKIKVRKAISGNYKHVWDEGTPGELIPYGLDKLHMAYEQGYLVIGEGESDGWACWYHDIPYLGLPGASTARKLTRLGEGIQRIYILHEPDQVKKLQYSGQSFYKDVHNTLRDLGYKGEIFCAHFKQLTGCKDPGELHITLWDEHAETFKSTLLQALEHATPAGDESPKHKFTYASEVVEQPIEWIWEGRLARGELTLGVGDAGLGKGLSIAKTTAHITRGLALPGGPNLEPGGVILMSPEDSASRTIVPRLRAANADLSKVLLLTEVDDRDLDTNEAYKRPVSFPEDALILREAIEDVGAVAVFIDPVLSMISGKVDVYKNHAVRQAMAQVMSTADKHGCAVYGVIHTTKGQHPNALFRSSSSTAFIEMARVALFYVPDPDGEADKSGVIVNHKNNLAERAPSIRYAIHKTADNIGYITWEGMSTHTRDELLNQVAPNGSKSIQETDLLTILKTNEVAMTIADILAQLQNGQTADALEIMLRRKVEQGILIKPARGLYTYADNPLYSANKKHTQNDVGNVDNVGMSEMSVSDLQNAEKIPKTDMKPTMSESSNGHKPASEAALPETDISDIKNKVDMSESLFPAPSLYNDGPRTALEAAALIGKWGFTPRGDYGQVIHTTSDRVDMDVAGKIIHLRGNEIPQIRVRS